MSDSNPDYFGYEVYSCEKESVFENFEFGVYCSKIDNVYYLEEIDSEYKSKNIGDELVLRKADRLIYNKVRRFADFMDYVYFCTCEAIFDYESVALVSLHS